ERKDSPVALFSGGMRRRLEVARGLMHSPRVLFLDEPTIGLDPQTRSSIWSYIKLLKETEDITIFMTTHYMDEAEYCDRIAIMDQGAIVALDTPEALKAEVGADRVTIDTDDDTAAIEALKETFGIEAVVAEGKVTFGVPGGHELVLFLFVLGSGLQQLSRASTHGVDLKTFIYPGILCLAVMFTAMFSAASIVWDREFGFLREMMVAPVRRSSIVIGKCLGGATVASFQGIILLCLAGAVDVPYAPTLILGVFALQLLLAFSITAFGVMVAVRIKQ